ncbi:uncharacterized protein PHALS_10057 [Plasmopara halstedii]|uniref:C2 domain-containing protein n=1 Tax=Plasmopara halstedii TaxID=4781 RepID=A0A0P1AGE3_PLAHL|nr:uncharacterized protein PHALS_10057 [Plasmopara halstedii]CEG39823.1 hypothetical protein PHALS_10057 [Plasmopara halstedii]|eukprot:XP_024576192.1 hypothetical protein PHALS_10057 [Plasmopara halstedii]
MTKSFITKAFPSPNKKLWGSHSSPIGVDDPTDVNMGSNDQSSDAVRGDICEIIVVAIQKVTSAASAAGDDANTLSPSQRQGSSIWSSTKWSNERSQLPERIICTVSSATTTKVSAHSERIGNNFIFDEKFVFERRENDAQYRNVTIDVSSAVPYFGRKRRLGQIEVDLETTFATQSSGPVSKRSTMKTANGSESDIEIHYVLHRLEVPNATAAAASRVLTRSSTSLNDDDDMDACGQIFPDLWYLC